MTTFHFDVLLCENQHRNESTEVNERKINSFYFFYGGMGNFLIGNLNRVSLVSLMFY